MKTQDEINKTAKEIGDLLGICPNSLAEILKHATHHTAVLTTDGKQSDWSLTIQKRIPAGEFQK